VKQETRGILAQVDHTCLNEVFPFTELNPTAENIAKWVWEMLSKRIDGTSMRVGRVAVWESDSACATYVP
jgi:6-pyruvoyltetrahydropterin/6-carboxytetrahydropterin synthase